MTAFKQRMIGAFDSAERYDSFAFVQQQVAETLARRILATSLREGARILEVGCGTGFLAAAAQPLPEGADWLMTDVSPAMVERSRIRLGRNGYRFAVMDAEAPGLAGAEAPFDLICSSLAAQWFEKLEETLSRLSRLLRPGGQLLLSTLTAGTFAEWRNAHERLGYPPGTPSYPTAEALRAMRPTGQAGAVDVQCFSSDYRNGRDFLHMLRAIGASTPRPGHRPLSAKAMREVMRDFEEQGARVTYEVAFCRFVGPDRAA